MEFKFQIFESVLERVRRSYRLYIYGYGIMPEHVHLLLSEPNCPTQAKTGLEWATPDWLDETQHYTLSDALKSLKQGVSRRLIGNRPLKPKPA